jgi:hypothetical protein
VSVGRWPVVAVLALAGACAKGGPAPVDAGSAAPAARVRHSTDLRSALVLAFPEYRGVPQVQAEAIVIRELSGARDWAAVRAEHLQRQAFTPDPEGGLGGARPPYRFELDPRGDRATATLVLPVDGETIMRVFQTPSAVSSADLALLLPRGGGLVTERDVFELHVSYAALPESRAAFLVRQVARLLLDNGQWKPRTLPERWGESLDAGPEVLPERFDLELESQQDGATLWVHREGRFVDVLYTLVTDAPAP